MKIEKYIEGLYGIHTDLDLIVLKKTADDMHKIIQTCFKNDEHDYNGNVTVTTKLYKKYNFLLFPLPGVHELYWAIHNAFHQCLTDHFGVVNQRFIIQCWMNYYKKGEFIDWHGHMPEDVGGWHGFFCLDTEPDSYTSYRWPNDDSRKGLTLDVESKNGLIVLGRSNLDLHKSSEWQHEDRARITIAFDILPVSYIKDVCSNAMKNDPYYINHWIPI